jgi:hypothetical protein
MLATEKYTHWINRFAMLLIWAVIAIGIVLRLIIFFQNRNLIIDEANIVRNLFERDFLGLILPLKYEQYAPPVFLWIEELLSLIFGYGEKGLKLYPLFCGIAAMFVFRSLMKRLVEEPAIWLGVALLAFSPYLTEYSATIKQYMPDALIVLLLLYAALRNDILTLTGSRFILIWSLIGILAIMSSMPSVFALAGVGFYYFYQCIRQKKWSSVINLFIVGAIWLVAFGIYYYTILKPQIESDYLQTYHAQYFLYALPSNMDEWKHNWNRIEEILNNTTGWTFFNFAVTCVCMLIGVVVIARKRLDVLILTMSPVALTLLAAALNQYSLITRVILFMFPLLLIPFSYGFAQLWKTKFPLLKIVLMVTGFVMIFSFNRFDLFSKKFGFQEITAGLDYLKSKNARAEQVYIHHPSVPPLIYYTEIHPNKDKYRSLHDAHRLTWDTEYAELTRNVTDTVYFLYTGGFPDEEKDKRIEQLNRSVVQVDYFAIPDWVVFVYTYVPKTKADTTTNVRQ